MAQGVTAWEPTKGGGYDPKDPPIDIAPPRADYDRRTGTEGPDPQWQLARWIRRQLDEGLPAANRWRKQAKEADRFNAGHHFSKADEDALDLEQRPHAVFNAGQKFLRFVGGMQAQSKHEIQYLARNPHDDRQGAASDLVSKVHNWVIQNCDGDHERNRAFDDMLRRGMSWTDITLERHEDVSGLIVLRRVDGMEMIWDPRARSTCLADARWVAHERQISVSEAMKRWPQFAHVIHANKGMSSETDKPGEATLFNEQKAVPIEEGANQWPSVAPNHVRLIEFQWYEEVIGAYFVDPLTGQDDWLSEEAFAEYQRRWSRARPRLAAAAAAQGQPFGASPEIEHDRVLMREYKRCLLIGQTIVSGPITLPGRRFTLNCMTGSWDDEDGVWRGFMWLLMDPLKYMTKFANQVMEIITKTAKGGCTVEESAIDNLAEFEQQYSRTGGVRLVRDGKIGAVKPDDPPQIPAASVEMFRACSTMLNVVTGIDPAGAMGQGGGDVPAVTMRQRQMAAMLLLSDEFETLRRYELMEARTIFDFMRFIADNRWVRIGGADAQAVQLARDPFLLEYDVVMDEGTRDPNIREVQRDLVAKALPTLLRFNMIGPEVLDIVLYGLPGSLIRSLKQALMKQLQQKQQMAAQGLSDGGRGKPTSLAEVQARTAKLQAEAARAQAQAMNLAEGVKNARGKMILDALVEQQQMHLQQEEQQQQRQLQAGKQAIDAVVGLGSLLGGGDSGGGGQGGQ